MRAFAITMVYNEARNLPRWRRHYGQQLGEENLYILDHGSDDGSTEDLGRSNRIRLPRETFDDGKRARLVSALHTGLLNFYDAGLYTDADEFLVPDPARYAGLADYIARMPGDSATAVGLNIIQLTDREATLRPERPLFEQRRHGYFLSHMCKTAISRVPVRWFGGFHGCDRPPAIDPDLYLFHLKYVDREEALARQSVTRNLPWANDRIGRHQRQPDSYVEARFTNALKRPMEAEGFAFGTLTARLVRDIQVTPTGFHLPKETFAGPTVVRIPDRFVGTL